MAVVKFNDTDEFIHELRRDAHEVDRKILRLTYRRRQDSGTLPILSLAVIASAVIAGHVVALDERCGTYIPQSGEWEKVKADADKKFDAIKAVAGELGLEVRAGVFEGA